VAGDLIVAADGVHSSAVAAVLGAPNPARSTFHFAYRLLIPSKEIAADPETSQFAEGDDGQMKFMVGDGKRIVWYPCRK
jgi:salicylate hydroxylase